jgi:hypothetical protein
MKKICILLILISTLCAAQEKPKPESPKYEKFVKLDPRDIQTFIEALNQWKRLVLYDPQLRPDQQVESYKSIEQYAAGIILRVKLDSALIRKDSVDIKPKKK